MERLTKSGAVSQKDINELLESTNENQFGMNDTYYKLQEYENLEEQDRLLKLPCKVGDAVYEVIENGDIVKYKITGISINDTNMCFIYGEGRYKEEKYYGKFLPSEFGKSVFLTKSEAEAKLKELRGGKVEEGYT